MTRFVWRGLTVMLVAFSITVIANAQSLPPAGADGTPAPSAESTAEGGVVKLFVRDVAGDYKNFLSFETATTVWFGGVSALAVHGADDALFEAANGPDAVTLPGGTTYGSQWLHIPMAAAWWVVAAAAGSARHADTGRDLLRAQLSVVSWTYAIKYATQRTRPNGDPHSFPSGHASTSFATATVLQEHYGWKAGLPAFVAAGYTAASRVADNQHWASDVVFGAFVGIASGRTVTIKFRDARVSVGPLAVPEGGGVLVTVKGQP